jgi:hypothetical protein
MREDLTVNIVLEEGAKGSNDSLRIVEQLRKQPETRDAAKILGSVSFGQKTKFPGLQISDSLSFGSLKIAPTNPGMTDLQQDAPLSDWEKAVQWKPPIYHCRLDETLLGAFKNDILETRRQVDFQPAMALRGEHAKDANRSLASPLDRAEPGLRLRSPLRVR